MPLDRELTKEIELSRSAYERELRDAENGLDLVRENIADGSWISRLWHRTEDRTRVEQLTNNLALVKARNEVAHEIVDWLRPQIELGIDKAIDEQLAQQRTLQPEREPQRGRQREDIDLER